MYHFQGAQQRVKNPLQLVFAQRFLARQIRGQTFPLHVFHRDIGRAVGFEKVMDADDSGVLEAGEDAGFVEETLQAPFEIRGSLGCLRNDGQVPFASSEVRGEVLLDRNGNIQGDVPPQVGDPEPAVAEDPVKLEVAYASPLRQRQAVLLFLDPSVGTVCVSQGRQSHLFSFPGAPR